MTSNVFLIHFEFAIATNTRITHCWWIDNIARNWLLNCNIKINLKIWQLKFITVESVRCDNGWQHFFSSLPWYKKLFVSILWWIDCLVEQQKMRNKFSTTKEYMQNEHKKGSPRKMCAIKFGRRKIYRNYIPFSIIFMLNIQHNGKITAAFNAVHIFSINIFFWLMKNISHFAFVAYFSNTFYILDSIS